MKREIKFRAFCKTKQKMNQVSSIIFEGANDGVRKISFMEKQHQPDEIELMQFTGMVDKNGVDIYEGDIIESKNIHGEFIGKSIVEFLNNQKDWNYNGYVLRIIDSHNKDNIGKKSSFSPNSIWWPSDEPSNFDSVIGNIYENPELLK